MNVFGIALVVALQQGFVPPIPPSYPEVFVSASRSHRSSAKCATKRAEAIWDFDGKIARFSKLVLLDKNFDSRVLEGLNRRVRALGGDVLVRIDCDANGAVIAFIESATAGMAVSKQFRYYYSEGELQIQELFSAGQ